MKAIKSFILNPFQRWKRLGLVLGVVLIYALPILTIPGLAAVYMKIEGIKGEVTTPNYEGMIEIDSMQLELARSIQSSPGAPRESSSPSFSDVTITKRTDSTSPHLFLEAAAGVVGKKVDLHFTTSVNGEERTYYLVTLSDVLVSGFSQSSGGENPTESLSLNFTKIEMSYTPYVGGKAGTPIRAGYDVMANKKL